MLATEVNDTQGVGVVGVAEARKHRLSAAPGSEPKTKRPGKNVWDSEWLPRRSSEPPNFKVCFPRMRVTLSAISRRRRIVKLGRKMLVPRLFAKPAIWIPTCPGSLGITLKLLYSHSRRRSFWLV